MAAKEQEMKRGDREKPDVLAYNPLSSLMKTDSATQRLRVVGERFLLVLTKEERSLLWERNCAHVHKEETETGLFEN